jgi:hypothetical protein
MINVHAIISKEHALRSVIVRERFQQAAFDLTQ